MATPRPSRISWQVAGAAGAVRLDLAHDVDGAEDATPAIYVLTPEQAAALGRALVAAAGAPVAITDVLTCDRCGTTAHRDMPARVGAPCHFCNEGTFRLMPVPPAPEPWRSKNG